MTDTVKLNVFTVLLSHSWMLICTLTKAVQCEYLQATAGILFYAICESCGLHKLHIA